MIAIGNEISSTRACASAVELAVDEQLAADGTLERRCRARRATADTGVHPRRRRSGSASARPTATFAVRTRAVLHGRDAGCRFQLGDRRVQDLRALDDHDD
jgi:hypothetical protein